MPALRICFAVERERAKQEEKKHTPHSPDPLPPPLFVSGDCVFAAASSFAAPLCAVSPLSGDSACVAASSSAAPLCAVSPLCVLPFSSPCVCLLHPYKESGRLEQHEGRGEEGRRDERADDELMKKREYPLIYGENGV